MSQTITQSSTGASAAVLLPRGQFAAMVKAAGWGVAKLQVSDNGTDWYDAEVHGGGVNITTNRSFRVLGGLYYRLNVTTYTNPVTVTFVQTLGVQLVPYTATVVTSGR